MRQRRDSLSAFRRTMHCRLSSELRLSNCLSNCCGDRAKIVTIALALCTVLYLAR